MVGNIGDSRAVLATRDDDNALIAVQLTIDLKPDLPSIYIPLPFTVDHLGSMDLTYFSMYVR